MSNVKPSLGANHIHHIQKLLLLPGENRHFQFILVWAHGPYPHDITYDCTRVFDVLYGAVEYGIFGGRTRTRTAVRRTFSI